jgi:glycosyltransferase involved in cell wall biosynthesis
MAQPTSISIVLSVYNEKESLPKLMNRFSEMAGASSYNFELIFVDDGSNDGSDSVIVGYRDMKIPHCRVRLIRFSRNFGHEAAMIAGIDFATGEAVICMDADLQHPFELIPQMIARFEAGFGVVTMIRKSNRGNSLAGNFFSSFFYFLINKLSAYRLQKNGSDFFLISRQIADILKSNYRERNRFLRGIIQIIGFPATSVSYIAPERVAGKTKYSFLKLTSLTTRAITSFSNAPLHLGIWFGFFFSFFSIILGIYTLCVFFFGKTPPSGYTTIVLFLSVSFSILFFMVGIIGIYVGYLFDEQKKRPIYVIEKDELIY